MLAYMHAICLTFSVLEWISAQFRGNHVISHQKLTSLTPFMWELRFRTWALEFLINMRGFRLVISPEPFDISAINFFKHAATVTPPWCNTQVNPLVIAISIFRTTNLAAKCLLTLTGWLGSHTIIPSDMFPWSNVDVPLPDGANVKETWSPAKAQFSPRDDALGAALSNDMFCKNSPQY